MDSSRTSPRGERAAGRQVSLNSLDPDIIESLIFLPDGDLSDIESDEDTDADPNWIPPGGDKNPEWIPRPTAHHQELDYEIPDESASAEKPNAETFSYKWEKEKFESPEVIYKNVFSDPPNDLPTPYEYFKQFITDSIIDNICIQSNMYALSKDGRTLNATCAEIRSLIGIYLYSGIVKMPAYRLYWQKGTVFPPIADAMSRNRFELLRQYFHLNDNNLAKRKDEPGYDRLFKIRPLLDGVRESFRKVEPEERQSIDEQIIPFKGRSYLKQYLKNKPHKWGFKVFARAGVSGFVHDLEMYTGKNSFPVSSMGLGSDVVLRLTEGIRNENHKVYFDNWFSSIELVQKLTENKIWCVGTIRANRLRNCELDTMKTLKEAGRGSFDYRIDKEKGIIIVRWYDSGTVQLISSYQGTDPTDHCKRWDKKEKKHVDIQRPAIVKEYNIHMGGVDLMDMLLELYRIDIRSKKWYMRIVYYCFDLSVCNSWILYRRHCKQRSEKSISLLDFRLQIAEALINTGKSNVPKRGRPSTERTEQAKRAKPCARPCIDVRCDQVAHFPEHSNKPMRCKNCVKGFTRISCTKCKVGLCLNKNKNCFFDFHVK